MVRWRASGRNCHLLAAEIDLLLIRRSRSLRKCSRARDIYFGRNKQTELVKFEETPRQILLCGVGVGLRHSVCVCVFAPRRAARQTAPDKRQSGMRASRLGACSAKIAPPDPLPRRAGAEVKLATRSSTHRLQASATSSSAAMQIRSALADAGAGAKVGAVADSSLTPASPDGQAAETCGDVAGRKNNALAEAGIWQRVSGDSSTPLD